MKNIEYNFKQITDTIPSHVTLVAVSKTQPESAIQALYDVGHRIFGENKVQEMVAKHTSLPKDIEWHMIGHLQSNKVKYIAPFVSLIHSVDSLALLKVINKEGQKNHRCIPCLLQFHIATEDTKFGLDLNEAETMLASEEYKNMQWVDIQGVMGMATFTDDAVLVSKEFNQLKQVFDVLKAGFFAGKSSFVHISMGMSDDYKLAIEHGSTMVRIGTSIFGERNYIQSQP